MNRGFFDTLAVIFLGVFALSLLLSVMAGNEILWLTGLSALLWGGLGAFCLLWLSEAAQFSQSQNDKNTGRTRTRTMLLPQRLLTGMDATALSRQLENVQKSLSTPLVAVLGCGVIYTGLMAAAIFCPVTPETANSSSIKVQIGLYFDTSASGLSAPDFYDLEGKIAAFLAQFAHSITIALAFWLMQLLFFTAAMARVLPWLCLGVFALLLLMLAELSTFGLAALYPLTQQFLVIAALLVYFLVLFLRRFWAALRKTAQRNRESFDNRLILAFLGGAMIVVMGFVTAAASPALWLVFFAALAALEAVTRPTGRKTYRLYH
ncbi:MAG: hypothetical protein ACK4VI_03690 [Alphaproteobacteria bacterium]